MLSHIAACAVYLATSLAVAPLLSASGNILQVFLELADDLISPRPHLLLAASIASGDLLLRAARVRGWLPYGLIGLLVPVPFVRLTGPFVGFEVSDWLFFFGPASLVAGAVLGLLRGRAPGEMWGFGACSSAAI